MKATQVQAFKEGDRVGIGWHGGHCHYCDMCRRGHFINCVNEQICGISYDWGYQEYVVAPWEALVRISDELSAEEAAPLLCGGVTMFNALHNSGDRPGDTVAIHGIGGLGHLAIQYARQMGFRTVDLSRGTAKQELAEKLGAHAYIDTAAQNTSEVLATMGGADLILVTPPISGAMAELTDGLSPRGKLLVIAAVSDPMSVVPMTHISGKSVAGWPSGSAIDSEDTLRFSALSEIRPKIETFPLEHANEAFARVIENKVRFRAVLTF